jgi:hypothetical protein
MGGAAAEVLQKLISTGEYGDPQTVAGITTYRRLKP